MSVTTYTTVNGRILRQNKDGVVHNFVSDPLGSVVMVRDTSGNTVYTAEYDPYGNVQSETGTNPSEFGYVGTLGYVKDSASSLYVRARYLLTNLGRWLTKDPLWPDERGFVYAGACPEVFWDSEGLEPRQNNNAGGRWGKGGTSGNTGRVNPGRQGNSGRPGAGGKPGPKPGPKPGTKPGTKPGATPRGKPDNRGGKGGSGLGAGAIVLLFAECIGYLEDGKIEACRSCCGSTVVLLGGTLGGMVGSRVCPNPWAVVVGGIVGAVVGAAYANEICEAVCGQLGLQDAAML